MFNTSRISMITCALVWVACLALSASADSPTSAKVDGRALLQAADTARGDAQGVIWDVIIESVEDGQKSSARYHVKSRAYNSLVEFIEPAKSRGNKLLMVDRNMWFIKPGLFKPVPISPRQRLLGNAANGDLASTNYASDYTIQSVIENEVNGVAAYSFDLKAAHKRVTYDRVRYWVAKDRKVAIKAEFYTLSGKLMKSATFEYKNNVSAGAGTRPFISKMLIQDAERADFVTALHFANVRLSEVPDATFNLNLIGR